MCSNDGGFPLEVRDSHGCFPNIKLHSFPMQHEVARLQHVKLHVAPLICVVSECVQGEEGGVRGQEDHRVVRCST